MSDWPDLSETTFFGQGSDDTRLPWYWWVLSTTTWHQAHSNLRERLPEYDTDPLIGQLARDVDRLATEGYAMVETAIAYMEAAPLPTPDPEALYVMLYNHIAANRRDLADELTRLWLVMLGGGGSDA